MDEGKNIARMRITRRAATAGLLSLAVPVRASAAASAPLVFAGARMAVELGPVHVALRKLYGEGARFVHGGVANLVGGKDRTADVASNGETQTLRQSVKGGPTCAC
ncbi:MAG: hypothetical protein WDN24_11805 [Sphingomonas sp.]